MAGGFVSVGVISEGSVTSGSVVGGSVSIGGVVGSVVEGTVASSLGEGVVSVPEIVMSFSMLLVVVSGTSSLQAHNDRHITSAKITDNAFFIVLPSFYKIKSA